MSGLTLFNEQAILFPLICPNFIVTCLSNSLVKKEEGRKGGTGEDKGK